MRVIFLDIDGVLNSTNSICADHMLYRALCEKYIEKLNPKMSNEDKWKLARNEYETITDDDYGQYFDHNCLRYLETLKILFPDIKFVISSSWRYAGVKSMKGMFSSRSNIISKDDILDITYCMSHPYVGEMFEYIKVISKEFADESNGLCRGMEIEAWIRWWNNKHPEDKVTDYLIFDDDSDMLKHQMNHFINTDTKTGFVYDDIKKAIEHFTIK